MTDITILLPLMNASELGIIFIMSLITQAESNYEVIAVNNSTDAQEKIAWKQKLERYGNEIKNFHYYEPEENLGLMGTMQYAYTHMDSPILVWVHTDIAMYRSGWDKLIIKKMQESDCGIVGVCGSKSIDTYGNRISLWASLVNYHGHALKLPTNTEQEVVILDGALMAMSKKMIDTTGGFDQYYTTGIYDYDISSQSFFGGFKNWVIDLPCFHLSGLSMNNHSFQNWLGNQHPLENRIQNKDNAYLDIMFNSYQHYMEKYKSKLPVTIN